MLQRQARRIARDHGWDRTMIDHLLHRYGSLLTELIDLIDDDPSLAEPLTGAPAYLRAEVAYAASHEGALHLEDVLVHRTRLVYEQADRGLGAIEEIADLVAERLGWSAERRAAEIASYTERCVAEEAASHEPDDGAAERARLRAADVAPLVPLGGAVDGGVAFG